VIVVVGADWLVDGAVGMARAFGVSDALIGLTVVAGTGDDRGLHGVR
jgi:cation:H+ antiporter